MLTPRQLAKLTMVVLALTFVGFALAHPPPPILWTQHTNSFATTSVEFSPGNDLVIVGSSELGVRLLDVASGTVVRTIDVMGDKLAVAPTGTVLAAATDASVALFDLATGEGIDIFTPVEAPIAALAWNPTGDLLAVSDYWNVTRIVGLANPRTITREFPYPSIALAFSPKNDVLVGLGFGGVIRIWSIDTGDEVTTIVPDSPELAGCVKFTPDGKRLIVAGVRNEVDSVNGIGFIDWYWTDTWTCTYSTFAAHGDMVHALAVSPDGACIATGGADGLLNCWSTSNYALRHTYQDPVCSQGDFLDTGIRAVDYSADGRFVAYGRWDGSVVLICNPDMLRPGDLDESGTVDLSDLALLLANFGEPIEPGGTGDIDRDGFVGLTDLATLLAWYGATC
ncbi:MAG: WD40 repeat domain-containing protein [Phycisphaerae bacterium]